jgi:hypothetical protein
LGHRFCDLASVREPDLALRACARPGQAHATGAAVVGVVGPLDEAALLEPGDQPRHARLGEQHVVEELGDP